MFRKNWMLIIAVLSMAGLFILNGCGSGEDAAPCTFDSDCAEGQECGPDFVCIDDLNPDGDKIDGDNIDGDVDNTVDGDKNVGDAHISAPDEIDFGAVNLGSPTYKDLVISNTGTGDLEISAMRFAIESPEFELMDYDPTKTYVIAPNGSLTFSVKYEPQVPQAASSVLQIANNDADNEDTLWTVLLLSDYKGESEFSADPAIIQFGNVRVSDPGVEIELSICNTGTGNKAITISAVGLKRPDTATHFQYDMNPEPELGKPVYVVNGECKQIMVRYMPQSETTFPAIHENCLVFINDADNNTDGQTEVCMAGTASQNSLDVYRNPIDFGMVEIGQTAVQTLEVENQTGAEVEVTDIRLSGNHCNEFSLFMGDHGIFPFTMEVDELITDIGVGYAPENTGIDQGCYLMISYTQGNRDEYSKTSISGQGKEANLAPIARVSRSNNGPDIQAPITVPSEATPAQQSLTFYGDISNDPDDGYPLSYEWTLEVPSDQSRAEISDPTAPIITTRVDLPGPYTFRLIVEDSEGARSEEKLVFVNVDVNEKITVDMEFDGSGPMNVDLKWVDPAGITCSRATMTSQRSCVMGDNGSAFMSNYTSASNDNGNKETVVHTGSEDGNYKIQLAYMNDCPDELFNCPMGFGTESTDVVVKIYLNEDTEPVYTMNTRLNAAGDSMEWKIVKVQGLWNEPTE